MRNLFTFLCLSFIYLNSFSQEPSWTNIDERKLKFPSSMYLTGFYSSPYDKGKPETEQLKVLLDYAKTDIVENISVAITSETNVRTEQTSKSFSQTLTAQSKSKAVAELTGLKTETYVDPKRKNVYAFAFIKRSEVIDFYKAKIADLTIKVTTLLDEAAQSKTQSKEKAWQKYQLCAPVFREMEEANAILLGMQKSNNAAELYALEQRARKGLDEIESSSPTSVDDAAFTLANALKAQLTNGKPIQVFPLSYQDSRMLSPFSARLLQSMQSKLPAAGIIIDASKSAQQVLEGTYWKEGTDLRLIITCRELSGNILASAEVRLPISAIDASGVSYLPENFEEASVRQKVFTKDEIVDGGLHVDLWTNKGSDNLIFYENDEMKLFVRVNHECYLRFIYYMADGSKVLLMDDYYISSDKVNKPIELPESFTCAEPFGVENLQANAQTTQFDKLNTTLKDGYQFINDDNASIQVKTRGFKKKENTDLKAEKRLTFTTMKK